MRKAGGREANRVVEREAQLEAAATGGVSYSYTDGGAAAPPTSSFATPILCSATPTFLRLSEFLALKR